MAKKASTKKTVRKKKVPPPVAAVIDPEQPFWIGFDLGGTKMLASVLDAGYQVLGTARKSTQGAQGATKGIKRILNTIEEAIAAAGVNPAKLQGVGIGCPGTVNPARGILITAPNLGWNRIPLGTALKRALQVPVTVLNDVDAGTFGEYEMGAGKGSRSLLGVFPGTGLGAGFVYDGKLVQGRHVSCMELGNIYVPGTHLNSPLPGVALLEDLTSRLGIASAASVECYRGRTPLLDGKTNASLRDMKSKALSNSFKAGEQATVTVFENSIHYLAMGVAMVVNLLAPDHITLGGGLVEELPRQYLQSLKTHLVRYTIPEIYQGTQFSIAKLGGQAVAIGAVAWHRRNSA